MKKYLSKKEAEKAVDEFFQNIEEKKPEEIKRIKKLAMSCKIPLKEKRKLFCKKCLNPYKTPSIRIRKGNKIITCEKCGFASRWKLIRPS